MKKGSFVIRLVPESEFKFEIVEGWLSDDGEYGYYKNDKNRWYATDIKSGMQICGNSMIGFATRKECIAFVENNADRILEAKQKQSYFNAVNALREYCLKELEQN